MIGKAEDIIKFRIFLFGICSLIVCVIGLVGFLYYEHYIKLVERETESELLNIADLKVSQIERWRKERAGDARVIAKTPFFGNQVSNYLANRHSSQ